MISKHKSALLLRVVMNNLSKSIRSCIELASELDILIHSASQSSLVASREFKAASRNAITYSDLYAIGNKMQDFNFMLHDYSFFQFSKEASSSDLRFAYYPNPLNIISLNDDKVYAQSLLVNGELTDEDFQQLLSEADPIMDTPLIRYDLSKSQHCKNYHPTAHFHIGFNSNNRWPVKRVLSPLGFFLNILNLYYSEIWKSKGEASQNGTNYLDEKFRSEIKKCLLLDHPHFEKIESERLHFS